MDRPVFIKAAALCCPEPGELQAFALQALPVDRSLLPAALRRRTSLTTQMAVTAAMHACDRAQCDASVLPSVFASVGGEIQVTDALCRTLPDREALLSPTRFHNSVHNTTAGYWSILNQCQAPTTAIAAIDDSFAMALLEAWAQLQQRPGELLLVCYDEQWSQYLAPPMGQAAFACALVLCSKSRQQLPAISRPKTEAEVYPVEKKLLHYIQRSPAAAAIPLLQAIEAPGMSGRIPLNISAPRWFTRLHRGAS